MDYNLHRDEQTPYVSSWFHPQFSVRCADILHVVGLLLSPKRIWAWAALFSTLERKQYQSYGRGTSRDVMVIEMGAPLCSLLLPAFTDSWMYM